MNTLLRIEPFRELETPEPKLLPVEDLPIADWAPLVDIAEDPEEYLLWAELGEIPRPDIKLRVAQGILTLSGVRALAPERKARKYYRMERGYGAFSRTFILPADADATKATAEYHAGVLQVHLPKTAKAKQKPLEIKIRYEKREKEISETGSEVQ